MPPLADFRIEWYGFRVEVAARGALVRLNENCFLNLDQLFREPSHCSRWLDGQQLL